MADRPTADGPEAYPYDPSLTLESQRGLDRLRCIADRALAANLFVLYVAAERNTMAAAAERDLQTRQGNQLKSLQTLAARAGAGGLGPKAQELADSLLLDERGVRVTDERSLRELASALRELRMLAG